MTLAQALGMISRGWAGLEFGGRLSVYFISLLLALKRRARGCWPWAGWPGEDGIKVFQVPLLSLLILLPLVWGAGLAFCAGRAEACRKLALAGALVELLLATSLLWLPEGQASVHGVWLLWEDSAWLPSLGIRYTLGLDGISLLLLLLTALLQVICVLVSWRQIDERPGLYYLLLFVMQSGVNGLFLAQDLFLFYLFWELQIVPCFFWWASGGMNGASPRPSNWCFSHLGAACCYWWAYWDSTRSTRSRVEKPASP